MISSCEIGDGVCHRESVEFFLSAVANLSEEQLIKRSPRGKKVGIILEIISKNAGSVADIALELMTLVNRCFLAYGKYKLPSAAQASLWSTFHRLRSNQSMRAAWNTFISSIIPCQHQEESPLCYQLVIDRMLKAVARMKVQERENEQVCASSAKSLTITESNAVRYMAGYVAVKLLKKYRKIAKHPKVQFKRSLFVRVLKGMKSENLPWQPDTPLEYTKAWSELIDRGGLYHINDDVFRLFESIEMITRQHISCKVVETYVPGRDLRKLIHEDIAKSTQVILLWEKLSDVIPF